MREGEAAMLVEILRAAPVPSVSRPRRAAWRRARGARRALAVTPAGTSPHAAREKPLAVSIGKSARFLKRNGAREKRRRRPRLANGRSAAGEAARRSAPREKRDRRASFGPRAKAAKAA